MKAATRAKMRERAVSFDPGPAVMVAAAAGMDLLFAEMKALAAILPGQPNAESADETPGEDEFDDLPV